MAKQVKPGGKQGGLRTALLWIGGGLALCCALGTGAAVISPPIRTPTPAATVTLQARVTEPARLAVLPSATAAPSKTPFPTPVASFTPEPTRTQTAPPTATRPVSTPAASATPKPTMPPAPTKPAATSTPKPAPTVTAIPTPAGPIFSQEGPSRRRVDPAWWPCQQNEVKGNRNSGIYHAPGMRDYAYTFSNVACFKNEAEAQNAGFRRAQR